jgi:hypothetical protein
VLSLHIEIFIFEKHQNLKFWWHFKVPQANCLWANFGGFGQIWEDSTTLTVAESMPELGLKSLKPHNFCTTSLNVTCSVSLEN